MIQQRKIGRVKNTVAQARDECGQIQSPDSRRCSDEKTGSRKQGDTQAQNAMRSPSIYEKTGEGLTGTGDREKHSHQCADLCIGKRVLLPEPGKQRRQHQMKEMRRAVGKSDERDYGRVTSDDT